MTRKIGQFDLYFNKEEQEALVKKFGTTDKKELKRLIKENSLEIGTIDVSTAKERKEEAQAQIAQAKAERIKEKEDEKLHKLHLGNEILERQLNYSNTFESIPSRQANSAMKKGIEQKYHNHGQANITETIQKKKNYTILKENLGYVGKCLLCKKSATELCSTGYEAECDMQLHLESIHEMELYQR